MSVSDTAGMAAKQETGSEEKGTDCGFVSTIKSGEHLLTSVCKYLWGKM